MLASPLRCAVRAMKTVITGATGLLGSNLAVALLGAGHSVICTRRAGSRTGHLDGFDIRWRDADLGDEEALARAFDGAEVVFNCAAHVAVQPKISARHLETNVEGTRRLLAALQRTGVPRLVHCSSVVTTAVSTTGQPVTETDPWNFPELGLADAYCQTKRMSEQLVLAAADEGLDAVVINPAFLFGPYDAKLSSGRLIVDLVRGRMPGYPLGNGSFVDVRDVVRGMIQAWQQGRAGQRYILGGHNMTYEAVLGLVANVAGVSPPRLPVPRSLSMLTALGCEAWQALGGREAALNSAMVRYSYNRGRIYSSAKAQKELGYSYGPLETAIRDAVEWFREAGVIR